MRGQWSWPGAVALVLAVFLGLGWATALILAASPVTDTITEPGVQLLSTIGGALTGALAAYLGSQITRRRDRDDDEP